ncbi:MAG: hypothetical protein K6F14_02680 [Clostridiales bacterium]|nr:hypothetical protein [Clostridiales bacterium]
MSKADGNVYVPKDKIDWNYDSNLIFAQKTYRKRPFKTLRDISKLVSVIFVILMLLLYAAFFVLLIVAIVNFNWHWSIVFIGIILVILILPVLRSFQKRAKFLRTIKRFKEENGSVNVNKLTKPYSTLFYISGQTDIRIETEYDVFDIMFFPTNSKRKRVMFNSDGKSAIFFSPIPLGKFGTILGLKPRVKRRDIEFKTDYDGDKTFHKILLLNPVPLEIAVFDKPGRPVRVSGPGEKLSDYSIENSSSMLRLIGSYL